MSEQCPKHGAVLAVRGRCPWGCGHVFEQVPTEAPPSVVWELQRATEATTLLHLTEPKTVTA